VTVTIDDDTPVTPTVSLSTSPNPVTDGSSVTATLSSALTRAVSIPGALTADTAESSDYGTLTSNHLTDLV